MATAQPGDTVLVRSGSYAETVFISPADRGLTLRGEGATQPIIEGEGVRRFGFQSLGSDVRIENFEITGQTEAGIFARGSDVEVADNVVHHIGSPSVTTSTGIRIAQGAGSVVESNRVHSVGPGSESMGIWLLQSRDAEVTGNTVYLIRKEGIRDWQGLNNTITGNRTFLSWTGVSLNTSTGSRVFNNYVYDNVYGVVAKHLSDARVLAYWGTGPQWSRVWHNTIWRSGGASVAIGQSGDPLDYLDIRNNVFQDAGFAYIHDMPSLRGDHLVVDGNAYAPAEQRPQYLYKAGWEQRPGLSSWQAYREQLGWETNGLRLDPGLNDPANGDLDYAASSPAAHGRVALNSPFGDQLGARGLPGTTAHWSPLPMTAIDSSSPDTWWTRHHLDATSDDNLFSYWLSSTNTDEFVTYDFGRKRTFDHLVLTVFSHADNRNIRGYRFEVSDDGSDWQTILAGVNPDDAGSSYKYELPSPATARYLRYTMVDTFCDSEAQSGCGEHFVLSDLKAGTVSDASLDDPDETEPRLRLASRQARLTAGRRLKVRLACGGEAADGCRGSVQITGLPRSGEPDSGPFLGRRDVRLSSGTTERVRVRLRKSQARALREPGSKVFATARVGESVVAERTLAVK